VEPSSFKNIKSKWIPEIKHHSSDSVQILLVGTKADLREDPHTLDRLEESGNEPISKNEGKKLAKELGLYDYLECSAATQEGVEEIFDNVIKAVLEDEKEISKATTNLNQKTPQQVNQPTVISKKPRKKSKCTIL